MAKEQKVYNKRDWVEFALGYLHLSELGCKEALSMRHQEDHFRIVSTYIPIVYNVKHAIEILIKTLRIELLGKSTLDQSDLHHDIDKLLSTLKGKVDGVKLKIELEKYQDRYPDRKYPFISTPVFDNLESLVDKYQSLAFIASISPEAKLAKDFKNTAFKYPSNDSGIEINYGDLTARVSANDTYMLLSDSIWLQGFVWEIHLILNQDKQKHDIT